MRVFSLLFIAFMAFNCSQDKKSAPTTSPLQVDQLTTNKSLVNTINSPYAKLQAVEINDVKWKDGFWAGRVETAASTMIPEMWGIYSDPEVSHAVRNFEIAAGLKEGEHEGAPFHDGDFYKLIEAASMAYAVTGDKKFDKMIDEVIPLIEASQREDGYIHTPVMIEARNNPETAVEFRDRMDFESYNMGHLMTAACLHYKSTGKTSLLEIAKKAADYLYTYTEKFPEKMAQNAICPSHYMGMVEMYRTTGDQKYLELSKKFIDIRAMVEEGTDHNQDRIPFREQEEAVGHAVRANYLYAGVADVYTETGDETLKNTLDKIWEDLVTSKLYITGGCGALYDGVSPNGTTYDPSKIQQVHQAYGKPFQLPNTSAHNETCANIGNILWNWRMLQSTGESRYADLIELTLYNSVLSGVNLNGKGYFYTNPLSHTKKLPYQLRWPNVREEYISLSNCCPPNTIRTIAEVSNYLYSKNENGVWFNMYASSELTTTLGEDQISFDQITNYPWDGSVYINIEEAPNRNLTLNFRIPDWCKKATLLVNGEKEDARIINGFMVAEKIWKDGDVVKLEMDMPATLIESNPLVEQTRNQVAIKRGPIVYCLEGVDLDVSYDLTDVIIPSDINLTPEKTEIAGVELISLTGTAEILADAEWQNTLYKEISTKKEPVEIRLIPYFAWANREEADMAVWLPLSR